MQSRCSGPVRWQDVKQVNIIIIAGREVQCTIPVSLGYFQSSSLDVLEKFLKGICVSLSGRYLEWRQIATEGDEAPAVCQRGVL
jgi:hypothetical protein